MENKLTQPLKETLAVFWHHKHKIIAICLLLVIALSFFNYSTSSAVVSVRMSLNYSEASRGLNPNSTRFNIHGFTSNAVLERVIKDAKLEGKITTKELADCIYIKAVDTSSVADQDTYISTAYNIVFNSKDVQNKIKGVSPQKILEIFCTAYKDDFVKNYGDNPSLLSKTNDDFSDGEPYLQLSALKLKAKQVQRYVDRRIKENTSFTDAKTSDNFLSIMKRISQLVDYDIPTVAGYIRETGIYKDKDMFISTLNYKNRMAYKDYDLLMGYYNSDNAGIKLYDEAMSSIVMIPSVDKQRQYYMSRTKTALDTMALNANGSLVGATETNEEIAETKHTIAQMSKGKNFTSDIEKADYLIKNLNQNLDDISKRLKDLDSSYIKHKNQNYISYKYSDVSFIDKLNIEKTAKVVGLFLAICLALYLLVRSYNKKHDIKSLKVTQMLMTLSKKLRIKKKGEINNDAKV